MSRLLRKGLDNLGKALRETGQALDRAGLEALGKDQHKELCECAGFICWDWHEGAVEGLNCCGLI